MKINKRETGNIIYPMEYHPLPRPLSPRECKCGCGNIFQPKRRDQVYLNKQHADYGYNHNTRDIKNLNRKEVEKILSINDKVLEKYFKAHRQENCAICYLDALKSNGFNTAHFIGIEEKDSKKHYYSYNYCYHIYIKDNIKLIKIYKI